MSDRDFDEYQEDVSQLIAHYEEMEKGDSQFFFEESSFEQIIEYYEDKQKNDKAVKVVDLAILQYPFSSYFLIKKAQFLFDNKQFNQALELLDKAEIYDPQDIQIYLLRSDIYVWMEDFKKAIATINNAIRIADEEDVVDMYLELADIYEEWEKYDKVFASLKKTLLLDPTNEEALNRMWFCTEFTEKYAEGIKFHKRIIDKEPYCYLAWYNLAHAYAGLGLFEKAVDAFEFVIAINEKYEHAHKDCGDVLVKMKDYARAIGFYKEAINLSKPSKELYYCVGQCYEYLKAHTKAREYYRKAIIVDPNFHEAFYRIGINYRLESKWANALSSYKRAHKLSGSNAEYLLALGEAYWENEDTDRAIESYQNALELKSTDKEVWVKLAKFYFEAGLFRKALDTLNDAANRFEDAADLYYIRSAMFYLIGNKHEAYLTLESALLQDFEAFPTIYEIAPVMQHDMTVENIIDQYR